MIEGDIILPPNPSRVMEGLRDTGYEFNTAVADIIDNSIAANADIIKIQIGVDFNNDLFVYILDNGCGMTFEELKNAMTYGSAERKNSASLGKFGLGLKTASTAFCRCLSVISRSDDLLLNKVQWDLDYIAKTSEWKLRILSPTGEELECLDDVAKDHSGTLVCWEKIDRLFNDKNKPSPKSLTSIIEKLKFHISMVYQKYLDSKNSSCSNVRIFVNDDEVECWDPFCKTEENTTILYDQEISIELGDGVEVPLVMNAYLLPRPEDFSNAANAKIANISNGMQGFYTYREGRLIHFGDWMGMFQNEPHISLLRVELAFDHRLDSAFNVDIKKSRILLDENIYSYIKDKIMPSLRRAADERYRTGIKKQTKKKSESTHEASNKNIEGKATSVEKSKLEVIDAKEGKVKVTNNNGSFITHHISISTPEVPGQTRVNTVENLDDGVLWKPSMINGQHAIDLNMSHPFYQKIYYPLSENSVLITGLDSLLWALAEAENSTIYDTQTQELYEDMRVMVSRSLKKLIADLPEPKGE